MICAGGLSIHLSILFRLLHFGRLVLPVSSIVYCVLHRTDGLSKKKKKIFFFFFYRLKVDIFFASFYDNDIRGLKAFLLLPLFNYLSPPSTWLFFFCFSFLQKVDESSLNKVRKKRLCVWEEERGALDGMWCHHRLLGKKRRGRRRHPLVSGRLSLGFSSSFLSSSYFAKLFFLKSNSFEIYYYY